jgi:hypothetical protein
MVVRIYGADDDYLAAKPYPTGTTGRLNIESGTWGGTVSLGVADHTQSGSGTTGTAAFALSHTEQWRAATVVLTAASHGINPLPPDDTNNAPPVCGAAGRDGGGNIAGIINTYYPATGTVNAGDKSITLGSPRGNSVGLAAGDTVMIIQIQDAVIDSSNSLDYGDGAPAGTPDASGSTDIHQTGLYEFAGVESISGNTLTLTTNLTHDYHQGTNQRFQVIRVPRYNNLTLSADLTALPWDGSVGGVIVVDVLGILNLNGHAVTASESGFRPGKYIGGRSTGKNVVNGDYVAVGVGNEISDLWGEKGEGIAGTPEYSYNTSGYPDGSLARGAPGNAGGGGQWP